MQKNNSKSGGKKNKSTHFESPLNELENIVTRLESGELPLEDALSKFECGVQLARQGQQSRNRQNNVYKC